MGSQFVNAAVIKHGSINIVTVKQGQAGISYDGGTLNVLPTGRHHLTASSQLFAGFLSLGQQVLKISQVVSMTSDNVGICFDAGGLRGCCCVLQRPRARTPSCCRRAQLSRSRSSTRARPS